MDLTIEQSCPSCGAPIELHEADRLIRCPFCEVGNYLVSAAEGASRFVLPDKAPDGIAREDMMYLPYLRFKGNIFSCLGRQVDHKVIDTTYQGTPLSSLPLSLGLRPQAMKVYPVTRNILGLFFQQAEKMTALFAKATDLAAIFSGEKAETLYHRAFIGETISCIYLPLYLQDELLYDAVLNRPVGERRAVVDLMQQARRYHPAWEPRFLATICPRCAGMLEGEHDSLVLVCSNCSSLWSESEGAFRPVSWEIIRSGEDGSMYLPFWRIRPDVSGVSLASFGDFLRLTNQPIVVRKEHETRDLCFWVPAFKIRPNLFLQLAKTMTLSQAKIPTGKTSVAKGMHPVTLPLSEAVQSLKTILADIAMDKRHFLPQLPGIGMRSGQTELVYLPFAASGHDLVQEQTAISIASAVLQFGRSL